MSHHHAQRSYVLIFNDMLKKHNASQSKYYPPRRQPPKQPKSQAQPTESAKPKPSISLSDVSANSVVPMHTATNSASVTSASKIPKIPSTSTNITSSPSAQSYVKSATQTGPLSASFNDRSGLLKLPSMVKQQTTRKTPPPKSAEYNEASPAPATNRPAARKQRRVVTNQEVAAKVSGKDSLPNVSQTPIANVGTSNSATQNGQATKGAHKHTSMAKTIAEQTPNAFKTLGPGFNTGAPVEKSITKASVSSSTLGVMPSDYEHIYHAPSQIADLVGTNTTSRSTSRKQVTKKAAKKK